MKSATKKQIAFYKEKHGLVLIEKNNNFLKINVEATLKENDGFGSHFIVTKKDWEYNSNWTEILIKNKCGCSKFGHRYSISDLVFKNELKIIGDDSFVWDDSFILYSFIEITNKCFEKMNIKKIKDIDHELLIYKKPIQI